GDPAAAAARPRRRPGQRFPDPGRAEPRLRGADDRAPPRLVGTPPPGPARGAGPPRRAAHPARRGARLRGRGHPVAPRAGGTAGDHAARPRTGDHPGRHLRLHRVAAAAACHPSATRREARPGRGGRGRAHGRGRAAARRGPPRGPDLRLRGGARLRLARPDADPAARGGLPRAGGGGERVRRPRGDRPRRPRRRRLDLQPRRERGVRPGAPSGLPPRRLRPAHPDADRRPQHDPRPGRGGARLHPRDPGLGGHPVPRRHAAHRARSGPAQDVLRAPQRGRAEGSDGAAPDPGRPAAGSAGL
ncbi:MAG: Chromosome initiation inhibitor, partial [uncultured Nocardioides sp.]